MIMIIGKKLCQFRFKKKNYCIPYKKIFLHVEGLILQQNTRWWDMLCTSEYMNDEHFLFKFVLCNILSFSYKFCI